MKILINIEIEDDLNSIADYEEAGYSKECMENMYNNTLGAFLRNSYNDNLVNITIDTNIVDSEK